MAASFFVILCLHSLGLLLSGAHTVLTSKTVKTPRGDVNMLNSELIELVEVVTETPAHDTYFFYPFMPLLPFLTARDHVSKFDVFSPGYTSPFQYQDACISVLKHASWVIVDSNWTNSDVLKNNYPAMDEFAPEERKRFELVLEQAFNLVTQIGPFEIRQRVKLIDETVCTGVTS